VLPTIISKLQFELGCSVTSVQYLERKWYGRTANYIHNVTTGVSPRTSVQLS